MFENKLINGVHATRYIASWINSGGSLDEDPCGRFDFRRWLRSLRLEEDDVRFIFNLATNGKLELEFSAEEFMKQE